MPPELRKRPEPGEAEAETSADQPSLVDPGFGDGGGDDNGGGGYSPLNTKKEVSTSSSLSLKCPICDCAFLNKSDLRSHYRRHPGVDKPFRCTFPKCTNTEWALKTKLTRHICAKHLRKPNEISLAKANKYIVFLKDVYEAETATLGLGAEEALPSTKANRPSMRYCHSSAVLLPDSQQTPEEMAAAAAVAAAISSAAKAAAEKALSPAGNADDANSKESDETEEEDNGNSEDKDDESEEKDKTEDKDKEEEEEESDEVEFLSEQPFSVVHQVATSGNYLCPGRGCPHQTAELAKLKVHYRKRHGPADHRPYRCCFNAGRCAFAADQLIKVKRHIRVSHLREIDDDLVEKETAENMADKDDDLEEDLAISTDGGSEFSCIEVDTSLEDRLFSQAKIVQLTVPPLPVRPPPPEKPASQASKLIFKPLPPTFFHQALQLRPTISTEGALPVKPKPSAANALQKRKRRKAKMYLPFACPYRSCEAAFSTLQKLRLHFVNSTAHRNTARKPFYCTYSVDCKAQNAWREAVLEHIAERHFGVPAEQMANQTEDERFRNERYLGVRKNILKRELEAAEARAAERREARLKAEQELAAMTREKYRKGVYDSLATIWNRKG